MARRSGHFGESPQGRESQMPHAQPFCEKHTLSASKSQRIGPPMLDLSNSFAPAPATARHLCEVLAKACDLTPGGFVHDVLIRDTNGFEILTVEDSNAAMDALASDDENVLKDALRPLAYVADCYRKGTVILV